MSSLASHLAAAEALVRAGSFAAARGHIDKALELDPQSAAARRALFQLELEGGTPRACLGVALKSLEVDPDDLAAHIDHFVALCCNRLRREARDKLDAIAARFAVPSPELGRLELLHQEQFGDPDETIGAVAAYRGRFGDVPWLDEMDMLAQLEAVRLHSASQVAEKVLASSPEDPAAHFVLALLAFRSGRFGRARRHARKLIRIRPNQAGVGRELILASWLVWFPPFLIAHFVVQVIFWGDQGSGLVRGKYFFTPLGGLLVVVFWTVRNTPEALLAPNVPTKVAGGACLAGFLAWAIYDLTLPLVGNWLRARRPRLRLKPDY